MRDICKNNSNLTSQLPQHQQDEKQDKKFLPMLHGKATDSIAKMAGKPIEKNILNNTGTIDAGEIKLVIEAFNELKGTLGISTHKLLSVAVAKFTELNHTGASKRENRHTEVNIPLKEYALYCGYDVLKHDTETEEEALREANRAENALKNARKKINKDLDIMFSSKLTWREKVRGKQGDYMDIRLIEAKGIKRGFVKLKFTQTFSDYLIGLPLTQFPIALLGVDERKNNAYDMGLKMANHYSMDNNHTRGTSQLLKVSTLLNVTSLPKADSQAVMETSWRARIKEPFEKALDTLYQCNFLSDWEYSHSKGVQMTDDEATNWASYDEWANSFVYFTIKNAPDQTKRLEARAEEKKNRQVKKTKKR